MGHSWTYRWNAQVFAGAGYVVVMPNPRGSTGYGQKFTDEINQDWGGKPYDDIMAVVDQMIGRRTSTRNGWRRPVVPTAATWLTGCSGIRDRFKAFVSHAGVFDLRSMAGETEELWFPIWEFNGIPWDNPETYAKLSPSSYVRISKRRHSFFTANSTTASRSAKACNCLLPFRCRRYRQKSWCSRMKVIGF